MDLTESMGGLIKVNLEIVYWLENFYECADAMLRLPPEGIGGKKKDHSCQKHHFGVLYRTNK